MPFLVRVAQREHHRWSNLLARFMATGSTSVGSGRLRTRAVGSSPQLGRDNARTAAKDQAACVDQHARVHPPPPPVAVASQPPPSGPACVAPNRARSPATASNP